MSSPASTIEFATMRISLPQAVLQALRAYEPVTATSQDAHFTLVRAENPEETAAAFKV
jgi:hypothetical protein